MPKADTLRKHGDTAHHRRLQRRRRAKKRKGSAGRAKEASYSAQMAGLRGYVVLPVTMLVMADYLVAKSERIASSATVRRHAHFIASCGSLLTS